MKELASANIGFLTVFGLGGIIFLIGYVMMIKGKALIWADPKQRVWAIMGLVILAINLAFQGYLQFIAARF